MNARIRLVHLDGKLPNLALMKLAAWHKRQGNQVTLSRSVHPNLFEPAEYDAIYGSTIFEKSHQKARDLLAAYSDAIIGGTGTLLNKNATIEQVIGEQSFEVYDYGIYPKYPWSLGFTQRGCRLRCPFCVVPEKEGRPFTVNRISDIWRPGTPKKVTLLDNDFFGQEEEQWRQRLQELEGGQYEVCFSQGINIRLITDEAAQGLARVSYRNSRFTEKRLYTAWDNMRDERIFFRGFNKLTEAGIEPSHLMVYMLTGYRDGETLEEVFNRYHKMKDAGCMPYPMVYDDRNRTLKAFQRWVVRRYDDYVPWEDYARRKRVNPDLRQATVRHTILLTPERARLQP